MQPDLSDSLSAAKNLLGWKLIHESAEGLNSGMIVETEAYSAQDAASHSYRGKTERTAVMFGLAGYLYVYFTYGMHYCVNVVTGADGDGQAVLIRALEPVSGIDVMQARRGRVDELTNGPAKLAQAMGLHKQDNGTNLLNGGTIRLEPGMPPAKITQTTRIGITKAIDLPWRFYITGNLHVSRP